MADALDSTRRALIALLQPVAAGLAAVYDEKNAGDKGAPNVSCGASDAREEPVGSGNFMVDAEVVVVALGAVDADGVDPKPVADALTAAVLGALEVSDLAAQLSGVIGSYTVFGFGEEKSFNQGVDGDCWKTTWKRQIYCCCKSL